MLPWAFKTGGLGEPRTVCPRVSMAKEEKCYYSHFCICIWSCSLYMQIGVNNELSNISASVRTMTSSLFSALKFIEKRHCFFKIALAVISGSVHCWWEQKASWGWYTGAEDQLRISSADQLQSRQQQQYPTSAERIIPDMGKRKLPAAY